MTDYTPSGKPIAGRAISKEIRSEFEDRIAPAVNSKANIASPALTGAPTAPTAAAGSAGNQIATLDFVNATSFSINLPGQIGNNGKVIVTDGIDASWTDTFTVPWTFSDVVSVDAAMTMTDAINTARATVAAHATTADIWGAAGNEINFTGTATITDFPDAPQAGVSRVLHIAGSPTFTHNANISLPNSADYTAEAGDIAIVHAITTTTFRVAFHQVNALVVRQSPIFKSDTLNKIAVSSGENISIQSYATGLASGTINVIRTGTLFVAFTSASSGFVATSPDGETWTLRAMPSAAVWRCGYSNGKVLASNAVSSTAMAQSIDDGVTWTSAPVLAIGANNDVSNCPVGVGNTRLISGTSTNYNLSTDNGNSWTTGTLPEVPVGAFFMVVGGRFIINTGTGLRHSSTGLTGSWVDSTGSSVQWMNPDGSAGAQDGGVTKRSAAMPPVWSEVVKGSYGSLSASSSHRFYIDGITGIWTTTANESYSFHGGSAVPRSSTRNVVSTANRLSASDGAGISVIGADSGYVIKVSDSLTGLFVL
jgi:hypothetical protein